MQKYIIYLATNKVNNKKYIGQTKEHRLTRRIFEHLFDATHLDNNVAFHNAILKYGLDNFVFTVIEENILESDVDDRERYWIKKYNTYIHAPNSCGYNETLGGQGTHGYKFTKADRTKMSLKQKAYWVNLKENSINEYNRLCEIRRQNKLNFKWSDESRKKLSNSCKGRVPWNKGVKGKQLAWNKGTSTNPVVLMLNPETNKIIDRFSNAYEAARKMFPEKDEKTTASRIFIVCKANKGKAYGYL